MQLLFKHRWLRRLAIAFAAFLLLWLLLWALVPVVAKSQLEKQASAKLGRQVHVGAVEFRPWSLELTLRDLRIAKSQTAGAGQEEPAPSSPQLQVDRIYVNASIQSLFRLAPVLDAIEVDAPVLRLTQQSLGHFDVDDVLARLAEPSDTPPAKPLGFALYNIALRDGRVQLQDDVQQREHMLDQLQLKLPFISNLESKREIKVLPHLSFALNGSRFESSAQSTPFTDQRQTAVDLSWQGVDLTPYLGYVPANAPVKPRSGVLDTNLHISFEQASRPWCGSPARSACPVPSCLTAMRRPCCVSSAWRPCSRTCSPCSRWWSLSPCSGALQRFSRPVMRKAASTGWRWAVALPPIPDRQWKSLPPMRLSPGR